MSDLQTDLKALANGLNAFVRTLVNSGKEKTLSQIVAPRPPAQPQTPPPDFEMDLDLGHAPLAQPDVPRRAPKVHPERGHLMSKLRHPSSVQDAFVLSEILSQPRAFRPLRRR